MVPLRRAPPSLEPSRRRQRRRWYLRGEVPAWLVPSRRASRARWYLRGARVGVDGRSCPLYASFVPAMVAGVLRWYQRCGRGDRNSPSTACRPRLAAWSALESWSARMVGTCAAALAGIVGTFPASLPASLVPSRRAGGRRWSVVPAICKFRANDARLSAALVPTMRPGVTGTRQPWLFRPGCGSDGAGELVGLHHWNLRRGGKGVAGTNDAGGDDKNSPTMPSQTRLRHRRRFPRTPRKPVPGVANVSNAHDESDGARQSCRHQALREHPRHQRSLLSRASRPSQPGFESSRP